mgnify:CR=1 FL=1
MNNLHSQHSLTPTTYRDQKANCDGLCDIDHDRISNTNPNLMQCVTCLFCKVVVDSIFTPETIEFQNCKMVVKR